MCRKSRTTQDAQHTSSEIISIYTEILFSLNDTGYEKKRKKNKCYCPTGGGHVRIKIEIHNTHSNHHMATMSEILLQIILWNIMNIAKNVQAAFYCCQYGLFYICWEV